jgi:hypothetical protein
VPGVELSEHLILGAQQILPLTIDHSHEVINILICLLLLGLYLLYLPGILRRIIHLLLILQLLLRDNLPLNLDILLRQLILELTVTISPIRLQLYNLLLPHPLNQIGTDTQLLHIEEHRVVAVVGADHVDDLAVRGEHAVVVVLDLRDVHAAVLGAGDQEGEVRGDFHVCDGRLVKAGLGVVFGKY